MIVLSIDIGDKEDTVDFDLTPEQTQFAQSVRTWVNRNYPRERARELEAADGIFPAELWNDMADAGFHGIGIPVELDGQGGDAITQSILARELSRTLAGLAGVWGVSSFAGAKTLGTYGTDEQRERLLPRLAAGEIRFSISVTEPGGGTDLLGGMQTTLHPTPSGFLLRGQKMWSSGANTSDYLVVLARDPEAGPRAVTTVLVERESTGVTTRRIPKLGMRCFSACEVFLDDVVVDSADVIGERGRGFHQLLPTLNNERIMTASHALGILDGVMEVALSHLQTRHAFGRPIGGFQALQHHVADIESWRQQAELLTLRAAWLQANDRPCGREATLAHYVCAEYANRASDLGIQLLGGLGYAMETDMQRYWRDSRLYRIAPISGEMARNVIAEGLGLPRSF